MKLCDRCIHKQVCSIKEKIYSTIHNFENIVKIDIASCLQYSCYYGNAIKEQINSPQKDYNKISAEILAATRKEEVKHEEVEPTEGLKCGQCGADNVQLVHCSECGKLVCPNCYTETVHGHEILCDECYDKSDPSWYM